MENIIKTLFSKREETISFSKEDQEKILGEEKIYLHSIINLITDKNIQAKLLKYEEQQNRINAVYNETFYTTGYQDALKTYKNI